MVSTAYPTMLPVPSAITVQSDERRLVPDAAGVRDSRAMQRDRLAMQQLVFVLPTFAECALFRDWWKSKLVYGASWFTATWVLPQGMVSAVRRFVGVPRWEYIASIGWRITATCELRGAGMDPFTCFVEDFASLSTYATVTGNRSLFTTASTPYGPGLAVLGQNSATVARISRSLASRSTVAVSIKFQLSASDTDDAAIFALRSGGADVFTFIAMREAAVDAQRRPSGTIRGEAHILAPAALAIGGWYQVSVVLSTTPNATTLTLTQLSDDTVVQVTPFASPQAPLVVDGVDFYADNGGPTLPTNFTALELC
jgi:hypothetical protein